MTNNNLTSIYQEICDNLMNDYDVVNANSINKLMNNHPKHQSELKKYIL